jgi:hypothetical protein
LVGPTADDDIRRAIQRYGAEAVKSAVKEATKAKRGRKREPDWPELRDVIDADAREWLAGGDPFAARSNYAIAKAFAERNPGHSVVSTHKRIERKLSKGPHDRRWFTLVTAEMLSRDNFPYMAHLRALKALADLPEASGRQIWKSMLDRMQSTLVDYGIREGELPPDEMTFQEIEEAVRKGGLSALSALPDGGGSFGSRYVGQSSLGSILSNAVERADD